MADSLDYSPAERFGRLYVASSQVSHAVVRSHSRDELLCEVTRVLVAYGKFAMAFVAWHDPETQELIPVARSGDSKDYVSRIRVFADERPAGQGPGGRAFRTGAPSIFNDFLNDPRAAHWRVAARDSGWRACAGFPLQMRSKPCAVLLVYAREGDFFGRDEVDLLDQVAGDVSIGLDRLEAEAQRQRAEVELLASQTRLKHALDAGGIGTFEWDVKTGETVWGGYSNRLFGFGPGECHGDTMQFRNRIHPEDLLAVYAAMETGRRDRVPFQYEYRVVWPDGSVHLLSGRAEFYYDNSGEAVRLCAAMVDVTANRRAEEALRETGERLLQATHVARIGVFDHDHVTGVSYWSPEMRAIFGFNAKLTASVEGYTARIHPDDRERVAAAIGRALDPDGDGTYDIEHRLLLSDGSVSWTRHCSRTHFAGEGTARKPIRTVGAVTDITEQKNAEAERARLEQQFFEAQKMESIGRLAGGVAHDFNNILTVIIGYSYLAKMKCEAGHRCLLELEQIEKAANRSRDITRQLLGFSRRQLIDPKPSNLNELLADWQHPLSRLIGEDIELRIVAQPDLWQALLDPSQVHQIVLNLVVNARDAMPKGGRLTIETANAELAEEDCRGHAGVTPGEFVSVAVTDDGAGMSAETMVHVFEPFFTTKEAGKGTGLGLATVYGIVQQNRGLVTVRSALGRGTTFRIYFPRLVPVNVRDFPHTSTAAEIGFGTVLLVEDDDSVREVTKLALESLGFKPLVARDAADALALCARPDLGIRLLLSDLVMAGMMGTELCERARSIRPGLRTLLMSGYSADFIAEDGVLKKGVQLLSKPFTVAELANKIAGVLAPGDDKLFH
jgi:two-component system cell cycle sensor histidine kinase/response regulator CckA